MDTTETLAALASCTYVVHLHLLMKRGMERGTDMKGGRTDIYFDSKRDTKGDMAHKDTVWGCGRYEV
jgi:hypothetical protein